MFLEKPTPKKKPIQLKDLFDFRNNHVNQIGLIFFSAFVLGTTLIYQFEERFDTEQWISQPSMRYKMVDEIIENKLLIGKSKEEVTVLLGSPNSSSTNGKDFYLYRLGIPPSFTESKKEQLLIVFENNKVAKVTVGKRMIK